MGIKKKTQGFLQEFKAFAMRGNVVDMAVGVIIGGAFTAIVTSLVNDILTPVISLLTKGVDISTLGIPLGEGEEAAILAYGAFLTKIIDFLIIALCVFMLVKFISKLQRPKKEEPAAPAPDPRKCPFCLQVIDDNATRCPHCTSVLPGYEEKVAEEKAG